MPGKPILNIEHGGYQRGPYHVFTGNYKSQEVCLERAWQCVFAGTYHTQYWQGAAWNVIVPDIEAFPLEDRHSNRRERTRWPAVLCILLMDVESSVGQDFS